MIDTASISQYVAAISALIAAYISYRNASHIQEIHLSINSKMDALLTSVKSESFAAGVLEGKTVAETKQASDDLSHAAGLAEGKASKLLVLATICMIASFI